MLAVMPQWKIDHIFTVAETHYNENEHKNKRTRSKLTDSENRTEAPSRRLLNELE